MPNPTNVATAQTIASSWGNAVVSRVVGIYASLAEANADGRTEDGQLITLADGSLWMRDGGKWLLVQPTTYGASLAGYSLQSAATAETMAGPTSVAALADAYPVSVFVTALVPVLATVGALVQVKVDISHTGGSTWNLGNWFAADIASGDRAVIAAAHSRESQIPTGTVQFRVQVKAAPMASAGDVETEAGHVQCFVHYDGTQNRA